MQDSWRAANRLTVNAGLRYDTETIFAKARPSRSTRTSNNVAPRVGATWTATEDGRTVVRGGFGIYYDQGFNNISGNISNSARSNNVTVLNPGYPDPYNGGTIAATKPSITIAAPVFTTPSTRTTSVGIRRELGPGFAVSVDGVRTLGYDLFNAVDINAPLPGNTVRPDPDVSPHRAVPDDRAELDQCVARLARTPYRAPRAHASTSPTRCRNRCGTSRTSDSCRRTRTIRPPRRPPPATIAVTRSSRPRVWALPWGFQASGLLQARSGLPWNVTTGSDNNGDQSVNDRPDLAAPGGDPTDKATYSTNFTGRVGNLARNANRGEAFAQLDLRLSKFVRFGRYSFEGFLEAFNALNRANLGTPNGTLTSSTFGSPTGLASGATPRQLELGFRFNF